MPEHSIIMSYPITCFRLFKLIFVLTLPIIFVVSLLKYSLNSPESWQEDIAQDIHRFKHSAQANIQKLEGKMLHGDPDRAGLIVGREMIKSYEVKTDGNYKMQIIFSANEPIIFAGNLQIGTCNSLSSGIAFQDKNSFNPTIFIDLEKCKDDVTFMLNAELKIQSWLPQQFSDDPERRLMRVLNSPIEISFDLLEMDLETVAASYAIAESVKYAENYKVYLDTKSKVSMSKLYDNEIRKFEQEDENIQFSFRTFEDSDYKTMSSKDSDLLGEDLNKTNFISLVPSNGFNLDKMVAVPVSCRVKDEKNKKQIRLWRLDDLISRNYEDSDDEMIEDKNIIEKEAHAHTNTQTRTKTCYENLKYDNTWGTWYFNVNFHKLFVDKFGENEETGDLAYTLICDVRVCGNTKGNSCYKEIHDCGYGNGGETETKFEMVPTPADVL